MKHTVHTKKDAAALQEVFHDQKVSYTLHYIYQDGQRDSMEFWKFDIPDPSQVFNAAIRSLYKSKPLGS